MRSPGARAGRSHRFRQTGPQLPARMPDGQDNPRAELDAALAAGEFSLAYQPLVDARDGRVVGAEALTRWMHPGVGWVSPEVFIPRAEQSGFIVELGHWVLREACGEAATWPAGATAKITVNVSGYELDQPDYVERVGAVLAEVGLPAERLVLEVTESALEADSPTAIDNLRELRKLGVRIAIDDFGTGYSSLSRLHHMPTDILKIDKSFVAAITSADQEAPLIAAIIAMAQALGLRTVAEGVEESHQAMLLARYGCDELQGWLRGRPGDPEQIRAALTPHAPADVEPATLPMPDTAESIQYRPASTSPEPIVRMLRRDRVLGLATLASGAWLAMYALLTWLSQSSPDFARFTANVVYLVPVAVAATTGTLAAWRRRHGNRTGRAWTIFAASSVLWLAGEITWALYAYLRPEGAPYPSFADVFYVLGAYLMPVGFLLAFGRGDGARRPRAILDVVLVTLGLGTLGWYELIAPQLADADGLGRLVTVLYPVSDVAILVCLLSLGLSGHERLPTSIRLVGSAYFLSAIFDGGYMYMTINGTYGDSSWINLGYQASALILALAGLVARRQHEHAPVRAHLRRDLTLGPLIIAAIAAWAVVAHDLTRTDTRTGSELDALLIATVVVAGLLYRQFLVTHDRTRLATQLQEALAEQARLAVTDSLTGLHNRRFLQHSLTVEVSRARRTGRPLSLVVLDLDHFKRINDEHGHPAGDAALVQSAQRLRAVARASDVIARQGGEEFAWLLPDTPLEGAIELAERLRVVLSDSPITVPRTAPIRVTGSLGVACMPGAVDGVTLVQEADRAMYRAKSDGRNRVVAALPSDLADPSVHDRRTDHPEPSVLT